jgi:hypothetical protein
VSDDVVLDADLDTPHACIVGTLAQEGNDPPGRHCAPDDILQPFVGAPRHVLILGLFVPGCHGDYPRARARVRLRHELGLDGLLDDQESVVVEDDAFDLADLAASDHEPLRIPHTAKYSPGAADNDFLQLGSLHSQTNSTRLTVGRLTSLTRSFTSRNSAWLRASRSVESFTTVSLARLLVYRRERRPQKRRWGEPTRDRKKRQ